MRFQSRSIVHCGPGMSLNSTLWVPFRVRGCCSFSLYGVLAVLVARTFWHMDIIAWAFLSVALIFCLLSCVCLSHQRRQTHLITDTVVKSAYTTLPRASTRNSHS